MGKWKKDKEGRFSGSIGTGKDNIPGPSPFSSLPSPATGAPSSAPDYQDLAARARSMQPHPSSGEFSYLAAAEAEVARAELRWENARSWAYPGVGDLEAEQELSQSYDELCLTRENLHRARLLAAQSPTGRNHLESEMAKWDTRASASHEGDGALKYLVRAQEIHDVLTEARQQQEVDDEFQRIIAATKAGAGSE